MAEESGWDSVALEHMRERSLIEADARYRVCVEAQPDTVLVALFDLDAPELHGEQVWQTVLPCPAEKTAAHALAAALRVLLEDLERGKVLPRAPGGRP